MRACRRVKDPLDNVDLSIIAYGVPFEHGENLKEKIIGMLGCITNMTNFNVVDSKRMRSQNPNKPPVKFAMASVEQKVDILRLKQDLRKVPSYSKVYMRSSKSHTERAMERNFQTLLQVFPDLAQQYRLAGHTVLVKKFDYSELPGGRQSNYQRQFQHPSTN